MNFVKHNLFVAFMLKSHRVFNLFLAVLLYISLAGYSNEVSLLSNHQMAEFTKVDFVCTSVDMDSLVHIEDGQAVYFGRNIPLPARFLRTCLTTPKTRICVKLKKHRYVV